MEINPIVLKKFLMQFPNKDWGDKYFDLIKEIIEDFRIDPNDERIALTLPLYGGFPVNVGQRYVLKARRGGELGLIMPLEYDVEQSIEQDNIVAIYENYFFRNKEREAWWIMFDMPEFVLPYHIKQLWRKQVAIELQRCKRSGFRKIHVPFLYKMVVDREVRERVWGQS